MQKMNKILLEESWHFCTHGGASMTYKDCKVNTKLSVLLLDEIEETKNKLQVYWFRKAKERVALEAILFTMGTTFFLSRSL